jgi:hypothetical protein
VNVDIDAQAAFRPQSVAKLEPSTQVNPATKLDEKQLKTAPQISNIAPILVYPKYNYHKSNTTPCCSLYSRHFRGRQTMLVARRSQGEGSILHRCATACNLIWPLEQECMYSTTCRDEKIKSLAPTVPQPPRSLPVCCAYLGAPNSPPQSCY